MSEKGIIDAPQTEALQRATPTPMDLLQMAVSQDLDVEKLEKLMQLQREWKKDQAREAFVVAMAAFKKNPPTITKNKHVSFGQTNYDHATLDNVCAAVTKGLSEHGISHRWKVEQLEASQIRLTCILTHSLGHSEETTLLGPPDASGSKNAIQAIGSSVTYLQRYTLLAATGLAASNGDNDGQGATNGELSEQCDWLANAKDLEELKKLFKDAYEMFSGSGAALKQLIAAKDARKKELS